MWKLAEPRHFSLSFFSILFPQLFSTLSLASWRWGGWNVPSELGSRLENGEHGNSLRWDVKSNFQRRVLEYYGILRWLTVHNNANRAVFSFGRERLRMAARRRQNSSSVRALRSDGVIHPGTRGDLGT